MIELGDIVLFQAKIGSVNAISDDTLTLHCNDGECRSADIKACVPVVKAKDIASQFYKGVTTG